MSPHKIDQNNPNLLILENKDLSQYSHMSRWDTGDRFRNPLKLGNYPAEIFIHSKGITYYKKQQGQDEAVWLEHHRFIDEFPEAIKIAEWIWTLTPVEVEAVFSFENMGLV